MKRLLLSSLMSLTLLPSVVWSQAAPTYLNNGTVDTPQVDAINFVNKGLFQTGDSFFPSGAIPYETSDTLNYTNKVGTFSGSGTMVGSPGFRFDNNSTTTGLRTMANSFFNDNGALVEADDPFAQYINSFLCAVAPVDPSYLLISATNIIIRGGTSGSPKASLRVGSNGEMKLEGKHIDISRSGLEVLPVWDGVFGSFLISTNFFQPDVAIYDQYWGRTNFSNNNPLFSDGLWDGQTANAPSEPVDFPNGFFGFSPPLILSNPLADSYVNVNPRTSITLTITNSDQSTSVITIFTNITKGAVFVGASTGGAAQIGFEPAFNNNFDTAGVLLSLQISNVVTTLLEPAYIFVQDTLGSGGTTGVLQNVIGCPPAAATFRPANYDVERLNISPGASGNNGYPEPNFFLDSGASDPSVLSDLVDNPVITNGEFSAYSAFLDNIISRPPLVAGGTVTNLPGRIRISADTLDMSRTRLRGEGQIILQTSHLISSSNAVVDCENLSFDLNSTNGNLKVQNLSKESVYRLRGNIYMWSGVWSNTAIVIFDNYAFDTNGTPTPAPITNTITIGFHAFMLDATALTTFLPVTVHDLVTHSTNVVISDNMTVVESVLIEGQSLTLDGNLAIPGAIPPANPILDPGGFFSPGVPLRDWTFANAPNLLYFTNHGTFSIANEAHFGDDRATPYSTLVNTGTINAASMQLNSTYFQNNGSLQTAGPLIMQSATGKLENGSSSSGGDSQFLSGTLKFNNYELTVNGGLYFNVVNALFDAGGSSSNVFNLQNGFNLQVRPQSGDLLGTTIQTIAPNVPSIEIDHTWAGEDRGPTVAGYSNNTAIGKLVLSSQSPDPFFFFSGTGLNNALYVDLLDISKLDTNYLNQIQIDPSLVIYYAAAKLGFTPPLTNGAVQEAEEFLDGQFGGHLRWVRDFAGPNSSVDVLVNGQTVKVNRALRNSAIIDSDGDGTPNFFDFTPFDTPLVVLVNGAGTVTPDYNGQVLALGQTYTMTAKAGAGSVFSNWTGGIVSASPQLTFTMQTNLILVANFVAHPFAMTAGSYNGLFYDSNDVERASSGTFTATTTPGGNYSGHLQMGLSRYPFSGHLNLAGAATNKFTRGGTNWLTLTLQMDLAANEHIGGTVSDGNWLADLQADRAVFNAIKYPSPFAGNYTLIFPGSGDPGNTGVPLGDGYSAVTVDRSGRIRLRGALPDGQILVQTAVVSRDGRWPIYAALDHAQGQLLGWLNFTNSVDEDVGGKVNWIKPPSAAAKFYPAGFNLEMQALGSAYTPATKVSFTNCVVTLMGGNLAESIVSNVTIESNNRVIDSSGNGLKLLFWPLQGLFRGNVVNPLTRRAVSFNGVVLQRQNMASGFFLGTNQSGRVDFNPGQ